MEQRIGTSSQPLEGAGFDPAFVPGLTSPVSKATEPEESEPKESEDRREETAEVTEEVAEDTAEAVDAAEPADEEGESADDRATDDTEATDDTDTDTEDDDEAAADGPVFEASDRRAKIVADRRGVRLTLDDQECEFRWDEIGAVETETARFGKRFTVTVHTPDRRWYPIEIEAAARSRFGEWESQLDAVLDAYFEESD